MPIAPSSVAHRLCRPGLQLSRHALQGKPARHTQGRQSRLSHGRCAPQQRWPTELSAGRYRPQQQQPHQQDSTMGQCLCCSGLQLSRHARQGTTCKASTQGCRLTDRQSTKVVTLCTGQALRNAALQRCPAAAANLLDRQCSGSAAALSRAAAFGGTPCSSSASPARRDPEAPPARAQVCNSGHVMDQKQDRFQSSAAGIACVVGTAA